MHGNKEQLRFKNRMEEKKPQYKGKQQGILYDKGTIEKYKTRLYVE